MKAQAEARAAAKESRWFESNAKRAATLRRKLAEMAADDPNRGKLQAQLQAIEDEVAGNAKRKAGEIEEVSAEVAAAVKELHEMQGLVFMSAIGLDAAEMATKQAREALNTSNAQDPAALRYTNSRLSAACRGPVALCCGTRFSWVVISQM